MPALTRKTGGSAGCALASRLSEDPIVRVLLIEAGGDGLQLDARIPAAVSNLQHSSSDWNEFAEEQSGRACTHLIDGKSFWPRGKCLGMECLIYCCKCVYLIMPGGSSVLNYMAYVRGHPNDYNSWASLLSDPKWGWNSVKDIFRRMENCTSIKDRIDTAERGMSGPLSVSMKYPINPIASAFVAAASTLGYRVGDYNGVSQEVASVLQTTTKNGARHSSADAYIWPIIRTRKNLHVLLNSEVSRIIFDHSVAVGHEPTAVGVEVHVKNICRIIRASKEVILSASAIGSPKLLLLSGIGPSDDLGRLGIPCVVNSPNVGRNLTDHLLTSVTVNASDIRPRVDIGTVNKQKAQNFPGGVFSLLQWMFTGRGYLASSTYDTTLFMKTKLNEDSPCPDIQLGESGRCVHDVLAAYAI